MFEFSLELFLLYNSKGFFLHLIYLLRMVVFLCEIPVDLFICVIIT